MILLYESLLPPLSHYQEVYPSTGSLKLSILDKYSMLTRSFAPPIHENTARIYRLAVQLRSTGTNQPKAPHLQSSSTFNAVLGGK